MKKSQDTYSLEASKRTLFGKKLNALRKLGTLPANIYGEGMESLAIELPIKEFIHMYKQAGETQVVHVQVDSKDIPTQIHNVHIHPISRMPIHADFKKVDLKKKTETPVPVEFIGESEAIEKKHGELNVMMQELLVSALPADIPQKIDIDLSVLAEIGDEILVKNIVISGNYQLLDDGESVVAKVNEHVEQSTEPETESVEPEIIDEKQPEASSEEEPAKEAEAEKADE
ncbi:MAG: 50S ribosomal protein L25 [Candidatus Roizmanbacteria bacterium]